MNLAIDAISEFCDFSNVISQWRAVNIDDGQLVLHAGIVSSWSVMSESGMIERPHSNLVI